MAKKTTAVSDKARFLFTTTVFGGMYQIEYCKLAGKAKSAGKQLTIYATPKMRFLIEDTKHSAGGSWLKDVIVAKYPACESVANNVGRGLTGEFAIFMSEHGRYDDIISKVCAGLKTGGVIMVSYPKDINEELKKLTRQKKETGIHAPKKRKEPVATPPGVGRGLTEPVAYKPSDFDNLDISGKIKAFKEKHGTTASKTTINAFIKQTRNEFEAILNEALWEAGVYGQSEKNVKVVKEAKHALPLAAKRK